MEYFKISFGSGKALNYVEYGRDKKRFVVKAIWLKTRERRRREEQEQRDSWTLWSKDFEERNDVMKVGREYWPAGWCLQKGRPSAIAISLEGSVEKYKAFIITLLVSFRFTGVGTRYSMINFSSLESLSLDESAPKRSIRVNAMLLTSSEKE